MSREIVTLQFGNYANYVGTHWWNIQEQSFNYNAQDGPSEINHDVLYREGINQNGQTTFTPRLLLVDLDGAAKHLPREGELYGNVLKRNSEAENVAESIKKLKEDLPWNDSEVEVIQEPLSEKPEFQKDLEDSEIDVEEREYNLTENVNSWADFSYARYHPRTVHIVKAFKHVADTEKLDTFCSGVQSWHAEQFDEDFSDRIRQYVEECDHLQGFQTICDGFNGFAGLATQCLQHLNDEYGKANFAIPVYTPRPVLYENADAAMSDSIRVVNSLLSFNQFIEHSSLFVPLSTTDRVWRQLGKPRQLTGVNYQSDNLYQTSAILASYLDTMSLRYRLRESAGNSTLSAFCGDMCNRGRKFAAAAVALPFTMAHKQDLIDCLDEFKGPLLTPLTPNCRLSDAYVIQSLCMRGIPKDNLKRPMEQAQQQMKMAAYKCNSVSEMLQLYMQCNYHASLTHVIATPMPLPTRLPYPSEIFDGKFTANGFLDENLKQQQNKVLSVPILAAVQSSAGLSDTLETLHREAKRIKINKLHRFRSAGLEDDDYVDALDSILLFKDNYEDNLEL